MRPSSISAVSILPADVRAATANGADIDMQAYEGAAMAILDAEAQGSGITATVKLQHASLVDGASYAVVGTNNIPLRHGTNDNILLSAKFTQSGVRQVKKASLMLRQLGTITTGDIWVTILADSAGDPTGSALVTSAKIAAASLPSVYQMVEFTFATALEVADATVYHVVLQGDYTVSDANQIQWRTATVASGGNANVFDSAYSAVATNSREFAIKQLQMADVTNGAFTAVANAASFQSLKVNLDGLGRYLRAVNTVAGGSATGALGVSLVAGAKYV